MTTCSLISMKRKLVQQGNSTLMVSLPAKWLEQNELKKGDEISIQENEGYLSLSKEGIKRKKEVELDVKDYHLTVVKSIITNCYRMGYEKIKINYESSIQYDAIEQTTRRWIIGFEVIKKEKNSCVIENITEPATEQYENILSKYFSNLEYLYELTKSRISGKSSKEEYGEFEETEERLLKYLNFCRRITAKESGRKGQFSTLMLATLNRAQREFYYIHTFIGKNKIKASKEITEFASESKGMLELIKKSYNEKKIAYISEMHLLHKKMLNEGYKIIAKSKGNESVVMHHLLSAMRTLYQVNSPLIGLLLL